MGLFNYNDDNAYSSKAIDSVQLIKIVFQQRQSDYGTYVSSSTDLARQTGFVCLVLFTDGTKRVDVVNLEDLNKKYARYLKQSDYCAL